MSVNTSFGRHAWALRCRFDRDTDPSDASASPAASSSSPRLRPGIAALIDAFRRQGHRHARLDPLAGPPTARTPVHSTCRDSILADDDAVAGGGRLGARRRGCAGASPALERACTAAP